MSKADRLSRIHTNFLYKLAEELNGDSIGSYRNYDGHAREELLELLSSKMTTEETERIVSEYLLCKSPSEAADTIKPASVEEIRRAVENHFDADGIVEVKVGRRTCDLVFPESLIAVEIKSARDKFDSAIDQLNHHAGWARKTYLAFDRSQESKIPAEFSETRFGLLVYEDGHVKEIQKSSNMDHSVGEYLEKMVYEHVENIARQRGLDTKGSKSALIERLQDMLDRSEAERLFMAYLASRD